MTMKICVLLCSAILYGLFLDTVYGVTVKIKNNGVRNKRQSESVEAEHEKFMIPKTLKIGDEISVSGNMTQHRRRVIVSLVLHSDESNSIDFDNIACQVMADFDRNNITIHAVVKGEHQEPLPAGFTTDDMFTGMVFKIRFIITGSEEQIIIQPNLNNSGSDSDCELKHDLKDIKYLILGGDMHKVDEIYFLLA